MQKNVHLLTYRMSTGRPAENDETHTEEGNDVNESSMPGQLDDSPSEEENPAQWIYREQAEGQSLLGFAAGIQQTFIAGIMDKIGDEGRARAAAMHSAKLILGPEYDVHGVIQAADWILNGNTEND